MKEYQPISGDYIFNALKDKKKIVLAANTRITKGITRGIFKAAKDTDSAIIIEIARTECNLEKGYIGYTPGEFAEAVKKAAKEAKHDIWALHADHIGIKKGTKKDIEETKKLIKHQIENGYTSYAIDASHLFNFEGKTEEEELELNIEATKEIGHYILENMGGKNFGLEVEVGEIGRKNEEGMILTTIAEAVIYIKKLNEAGLYPQLLAIANGSSHGNIYDSKGKLKKQVSINIERTKEITKALRREGLNTRIAQHGITGTPYQLIYTQFPHGDILKGNVGTFWMNIAYEVIQTYNPKLYADIHKWTIKNYKKEAKKIGMKTDEQIFGRYGKKAIKQFFKRIYSLNKEIEKELEAKAYIEALKFIKAFKLKGSATIVREWIEKNNKTI